MLRDIAQRTDGRYIPGADAKALAGLSDAVDLQWTVESRHIEVTALFAAAAAVLLTVGAGLSLAWFGRAV
jgi:Ca-activated chloride channel family protein